jgi:hypothetical protein
MHSDEKVWETLSSGFSGILMNKGKYWRLGGYP